MRKDRQERLVGVSGMGGRWREGARRREGRRWRGWLGWREKAGSGGKEEMRGASWREREGEERRERGWKSGRFLSWWGGGS